MITLKLKVKSDISSLSFFQEKWNSVYRFAFNRFMENETLSKFSSFSFIKNINNCDMIDLSWKRQAFNKAYALFKKVKKSKNKKIIFGGKNNFLKLKQHKITKEEFNKHKLIPILMEGSKADEGGNRKFKFNFDKMECSVMLNDFKLKFEVIPISDFNMNLFKIALQKAKNKELGITYSLNGEYLYVIFDETKLGINEDYKFIKNRLLSIDSNPNFIGYSIVDETGKKILSEVINLSNIKYNNKNKRKFELNQISKYIRSIAFHYKVEMIGIEKLSIENKNHSKGKCFNRMINNNWCRNHFINSLKKQCNIYKIKIQEILTQYSSFIGCVLHEHETDSIAASLEINRRLLLFKRIYLDKTQEKDDIIFPKWNINVLPTRWKEMAEMNGVSSWKELYQSIKNTKHSYRFLFNDWKQSREVLRFKSDSSLVDRIPCLG